MEWSCRRPSPLGGLTLTGDGAALTGLWFDGQRHYPSVLPPAREDLPLWREADRWLEQYFRGGVPDFTPPLAPKGTPFQNAVWALLRTIPYGETRSYGALAEQLGRASPRALGGAVARNPISLIIPCHRVVGSGGSLTGYAGGLERKEWLLRLEQSR